jgi:glycerophosphoryl diester phosphodiesterase
VIPVYRSTAGLTVVCCGGRNAAIVLRMRGLIVAVVLLAGCMGGACAIDLQGHRGARGLAPENTLAGFRTALGIGVTTLETDLALTRDRVLVLSHEPRLAAALTRGPDGAWLSADGAPFVRLDLADLARYDVGRLNPAHKYASQWPGQKAFDGERIPTLASLFALARDARSPGGQPVRFNIETKLTPDSGVPTPNPADFARAVVAAVLTSDMGARVSVQSFDWRTLIEVRKLAPQIATVCLTIESSGMNTVSLAGNGASPWHAGLKAADHGNSLPKLARAAGCSTWSPFWRNVSAELVEEAHALDLKVVPWTVNDVVEMERLVALRVDGLITDYPDRARQALAAKGIAVD